MSFGWPSLVGMISYYATSWLHDWAVGDTKELINSIKRQAKDRLGLLYGPSGYDFTDDQEFGESAREKNFNGLEPREVDEVRREQLFDLILDYFAVRRAGLSLDKLEASNDIKRAYKLIEVGYLSDAWFKAAKDYDKENAVATIDVIEQKSDEDLLDLPSDEGGLQGTSDIESSDSEERKPEQGGNAQKKVSGWDRHPPEMRSLFKKFVKKPDYKIHGPKGGTYGEWQRWYMKATKSPESWELLGKKQRKYLNNAETIRLLNILIDPGSIQTDGPEPGSYKPKK